MALVNEAHTQGGGDNSTITRGSQLALVTISISLINQHEKRMKQISPAWCVAREGLAQ